MKVLPIRDEQVKFITHFQELGYDKMINYEWRDIYYVWLFDGQFSWRLKV